MRRESNGRDQRAISAQLFAAQVPRLFDDVRLISGARPESISPAGRDEVLVNWQDGRTQRVRVASVHLGADRIRAERRAFKRYARAATEEAKRQMLLRLDG